MAESLTEAWVTVLAPLAGHRLSTSARRAVDRWRQRRFAPGKQSATLSSGDSRLGNNPLRSDVPKR